MEISFRRAQAQDVPAIVALLADDALGSQREEPALPLAEGYIAAFAAIKSDPNQLLAVVEDDARIVGTLHLTFIPGLARKGAWRGQIQAVRVTADRRRSGLGKAMFAWAIATCRARGCGHVQLMTDNGRPEAQLFYEKLGFTASHLGYKLPL